MAVHTLPLLKVKKAFGHFFFLIHLILLTLLVSDSFALSNLINLVTD